MTINISARSITDPALMPRITAALERTGVDPALVMFEVTETAAATATEELRSFGAEIERLGCSLAIDDFGTGFGSLTYLKHLPVRYLKIDMEFVRGLLESAADRAIVESIVTIAKSLDMLTVAEGVEDAETLDAPAGDRGRLRPGLPPRPPGARGRLSAAAPQPASGSSSCEPSSSRRRSIASA